jgi:hypothetical protein
VLAFYAIGPAWCAAAAAHAEAAWRQLRRLCARPEPALWRAMAAADGD